MLAVLERWLPYTVTILDRFHCTNVLLAILIALANAHVHLTFFHKRHVFTSQKHMLFMTKDIFSLQVKVAHSLRVVGGTEQQLHAFKEYTHVGV